jgi:hypothetical protein
VTLIKGGKMALLARNSKMKKSSTKNVGVYNFGIPAFRTTLGSVTCPNAKECVKTCFAQKGAYEIPVVERAYETKFLVTQSALFPVFLDKEITSLKRKHEKMYLRIHDSGDFYSEAYLGDWLETIKKHKDVSFYAYTKMVSMFKNRILPNNFKVIYSFGGK